MKNTLLIIIFSILSPQIAFTQAPDIEWQNTISGDDRDSVQQTTDGGYILGGYSRSGISGDKTEANHGDWDYWVVKLSADAPLDIEQQSNNVELGFTLLTAYPNPFNPSTTITYGLEKDSYVTVDIYDISGKLIATIQKKYQIQGWHSIAWNGTDDSGNKVGGGVYFYQVQARDFRQTRKMVLLK